MFLLVLKYSLPHVFAMAQKIFFFKHIQFLPESKVFHFRIPPAWPRVLFLCFSAHYFSQKSHTTCLIWERKPQWNLYQFLKQQIWHRLHFKDASQNFLCKVGTPLYSDLQAGWLSESSRNLKKNVTINYISIICTCMKKQGNLQLDMTRGGFQRNKKQHLQVPSTIWQEYKIRAAVY